MKNTILSILFSFLLLSCSDDDKPKDNQLNLSATELNLDSDYSSKIVTFEAKNPEGTTVSVDNSGKEWCNAEIMADNSLKITALANNSKEERSTSVTLNADNMVANIKVKQAPNEYLINEDIRLKVSGGEASSAETNNEATGFENSYDGDMSTIWHSKWSDQDTYPVTAVYHLEDADVLDYILYHPRMDGSNGNFGKIEVWVSTEAEPNYVKVMDYDCEEKGKVCKIEFAKPIEKPKSVTFIINSGSGGFASCAEMEFYKKGDENTTKFVDIAMSKAGYVEPDEYKGYVSGTMKLPYSSDGKALGKVFFKFTTAAKGRLQLKVKNAIEGKKIKVALNSFESEMDIPVTNGYQWLTITTSQFTPTTDYSCLILKNLSEGNVDIESLRIIGDISDGVEFNNHPDNRRNAVSVHLGYQLGDIKDVEWFYNEVTIPKGYDEPYHSYYMVNGWGKGYSGIQVRDKTGNNSKRWLIFSCWNTKENATEEYWAKVLNYGDNVKVESFGGEGTGAKTYLELDWVTEKTYQFLLQARVEGTSAFYSLFWKTKDEQDWKFQATILSPNNPAYLKGLYSFVENYIGSDGHYQRKANYANQWVKNSTGWQQLTKAKFTQDGGFKYRTDIGAAASGNSFDLWNGGYIATENTPNMILTRNASNNTQPISDADLENLAKISKE